MNAQEIRPGDSSQQCDLRQATIHLNLKSMRWDIHLYEQVMTQPINLIFRFLQNVSFPSHLTQWSTSMVVTL